ncbi:hypothetical protein QTO34_019244 [Cnephaeus nilssonii]|uniref:Uncharacterized protein n=1 Tax=Cnephaeus nilssonii TaxID=3371016 RepID=A0AA40HWH1_CNENI|nr:hypothetical protein QTO34_019244 [Eptesicus nilssonii]
MAQTLSLSCHWRRKLSVPLAQSAPPATLSPAPPRLLANRGHSEAHSWPTREQGGLLAKHHHGEGQRPIVTEPEVAKRPARRCWRGSSFLHEGMAISSRGIPLELVNADGVHSEIYCLNDISAQIREGKRDGGHCGLQPAKRARRQQQNILAAKTKSKL